MTALGRLPSWKPRLGLFSMAGVVSAVTDATGHGSVEHDIAEWHMGRARRRFAAAIRTDHAQEVER